MSTGAIIIPLSTTAIASSIVRVSSDMCCICNTEVTQWQEQNKRLLCIQTGCFLNVRGTGYHPECLAKHECVHAKNESENIHVSVLMQRKPLIATDPDSCCCKICDRQFDVNADEQQFKKLLCIDTNCPAHVRGTGCSSDCASVHAAKYHSGLSSAENPPCCSIVL